MYKNNIFWGKKLISKEHIVNKGFKLKILYWFCSNCFKYQKNMENILDCLWAPLLHLIIIQYNVYIYIYSMNI